VCLDVLYPVHFFSSMLFAFLVSRPHSIYLASGRLRPGWLCYSGCRYNAFLNNVFVFSLLSRKYVLGNLLRPYLLHLRFMIREAVSDLL
jgi:hypothetical protein